MSVTITLQKKHLWLLILIPILVAPFLVRGLLLQLKHDKEHPQVLYDTLVYRKWLDKRGQSECYMIVHDTTRFHPDSAAINSEGLEKSCLARSWVLVIDSASGDFSGTWDDTARRGLTEIHSYARMNFHIIDDHIYRR